MSGATYNALINYHWSGNIRELKHTLEKAVILCESSVMKPEDLNLKGRTIAKTEEDFTSSLSDIEKSAIIKALEKFHGNVSQAAHMLDISRTTLYAKMKEYKI